MLERLDNLPEHRSIVGKLVVGYGEIEFAVVTMLTCVLGSADQAFRILFRTRGEEQRLLIADALIRPFCEDKPSVKQAYEEAIADAHYCRRIRNQYAHCHWFPGVSDLVFTTLESEAKGNGQFKAETLHVSLDTLREQETYFDNVVFRMMFIQAELKRLSGVKPENEWDLAKKADRPPLYDR